VKPKLSVLDRESIEKIRQSALEILQDVGVKYESKVAEDLLREAGHSVDSETRVVRLKPDLVEEALAKLPSRVLLAGRDGSRDVVLGSGPTFTCNDGMGTFILDPQTGERRESTLTDLIMAMRLSDALESLDYSWPPLVPGDVPDSVRTLVECAAGFMSTTLHVQHELKHPEQVPFLLEMLDAVLGDHRRHAERPIFSVTCCTVAPLRHEPEMTDACIELAKHDVPINLMPMPLAGATAPVTLAGTLVMACAEFFSAAALYQLARPGAAMIFAAGATILDMRTGLYAAGAPELSLLNIAIADIAHHIGFPMMAQGLVTDAKNPGVQAAYEKAMNGMSAFLAGADVVNGLGLLDSNQILALEQLVIDDEMARLVRGVSRGFDVDTEHCMMDLIREVGIGGHYLGQRRTLDYLKKGEHIQPKLGFRGSYENWQGRQFDEVAAARERAQCLLKEHEILELTPEVNKALGETIVRADPSLGFDLKAACEGA